MIIVRAWGARIGLLIGATNCFHQLISQRFSGNYVSPLLPLSVLYSFFPLYDRYRALPSLARKGRGWRKFEQYCSS